MVFTDRRTGFSTTDLRDAEEQILQFNTINEIVWTPDGSRLPGYQVRNDNYGLSHSYSIEGKICPEGCVLVVRFGTRDGHRRAYLTADYGHDNPGTLVDVEVAGGGMVVTRTSVFPPGSPTLSGVVTEMAPMGAVPVEGVTVFRGVHTGWRSTTTDRNGFYQIQGLFDGPETVVTSKDGYQRETREVAIDGDTRFDIEIRR